MGEVGLQSVMHCLCQREAKRERVFFCRCCTPLPCFVLTYESLTCSLLGLQSGELVLVQVLSNCQSSQGQQGRWFLRHLPMHLLIEAVEPDSRSLP